MTAAVGAAPPLHGTWSAAASPQTSPTLTVHRGCGWSSVLSNRLVRCAAGFKLNAGAAVDVCSKTVLGLRSTCIGYAPYTKRSGHSTEPPLTRDTTRHAHVILMCLVSHALTVCFAHTTDDWTSIPVLDFVCGFERPVRARTYLLNRSGSLCAMDRLAGALSRRDCVHFLCLCICLHGARVCAISA